MRGLAIILEDPSGTLVNSSDVNAGVRQPRCLTSERSEADRQGKEESTFPLPSSVLRQPVPPLSPTSAFHLRSLPAHTLGVHWQALSTTTPASLIHLAH